MSRIPRWKTEKTKVKVVFRLQFHATHIPQSGWDKLFVSFIPVDTGKPSAKTNKASVRNGNCKWSDPIYETTRLLQDTRNKIYDEKLYKLLVAMGSSRSSFLGEVTINLADFADALKPSSIALPLNGCEFGTVLHVTVQLLTSKTGFREFEQQRELSVKGLQMPNHNQESRGPSAAASETSHENMDKAKARVRFKEAAKELPSLEEVGESTEEYEDSAVGIDGSSYTSDSVYAEKNDIAITYDMDGLKGTNDTYISSFPLSQSPGNEKREQHSSRLSTEGSNDWTHAWSSDYSVDNDLASAYEENNRLRVRLEVAESAFLQMKLEAKSLQQITDELGSETKSLAQQLLMELASGEELMREVSILKSECSSLRNDIETLKSAKSMQQNIQQGTLVQDVKYDPFDDSTDRKFQNSAYQDLQSTLLQGLLLIEGKVQGIQNKTCVGYTAHDLDFLHSDFKVLQCVIKNVKDALLGESGLNTVTSSCLANIEKTFCEIDLHRKKVEPSSMVEDQVFELLQKLDNSKIEKDSLTKKMDQMECYYEALVLELEESQKHTLQELESIRNEHSSCLYTITMLQGQIEKIHQELNEQLMSFAEDRSTLESQNKELEKRSIASETALKKIRWNYSVAVDRLQKDLELLSFQVLSMYETNENLAKQALSKPYQLCLEECSEETWPTSGRENTFIMLDQEMHKPVLSGAEFENLSKVNYEGSEMPNGAVEVVGGKKDNLTYQSGTPAYSNLTHDTYSELQRHEYCKTLPTVLSKREAEAPSKAKTFERSKLYSEADLQILVDEIGLEALCKSKGLHMLSEAEVSEIHMLNLHLKIHSEVLHETILDASAAITQLQHKISELEEQLTNASHTNESLMLKLQDMLDDARVLRADNSKFTSLCQDLSVKNQILEAKLQDISDENVFLTEKVIENEKIMEECRNYEDKYNSCIQERNKCENLLKEEILRRNFVQNQMSSTVEEYELLKVKHDKISSAYDSAQASVIHLKDQLRSLCSHVSASSDQINCVGLDTRDTLFTDLESENYMAVFTSLEKFQLFACSKVLELTDEKNKLEAMLDAAQSTIRQTESQILDVKLKFDSELEDVTAKLNMSNRTAEQLKLELETLLEKYKVSSETEQKNASKNEELSSKLMISEIELQQVISEKGDLLQQISALERAKEELENVEVAHRTLSMHIQSREEACFQMQNDLCNLQEKVKFTTESLQVEKERREGLESIVANLMSQLQDKDQQLFLLNENKYENSHLQDKILDLERSNAQLSDSLQRETVSREGLEASVANHMSQLEEKSKQILYLSEQNAVVNDLQDKVLILEEANCQLSNLLQIEKELREGLEAAAAKNMLQMEEKNQQLLFLSEQKAVIAHLHDKILVLETKNNELNNLLALNEENLSKVDGDNLSLRTQIIDSENYATTVFENYLTADIKITIMRSYYEARVLELVMQMKELNVELEKNNLEHENSILLLNAFSSNEAQLVEEKNRLSTALLSAKSELETIIEEKQELMDYISKSIATWDDVKDLKVEAPATIKAECNLEKHKYEAEILQLENLLISYEDELDSFSSSVVALEVTDAVVRSKLNEQQLVIEELGSELEILKEQNNDLSSKLNEQIVKTEGFKNLSIHLRELKEKADAEVNQAHEKKDNEGSSFAIQESLRIAFIKEQYESKIIELKNHLNVSKQYAEEMLLKFQNALDAVEVAKKSEASLVKKVEDLSMRTTDLENELQAVLTDKRELVKAYDNIKTELECTILSLDCMKEEKLRLEEALQECNEERMKVKVEFDLIKQLLDNMVSTQVIPSESDQELAAANRSLSVEQILGDAKFAHLNIFQKVLPEEHASTASATASLVANSAENMKGDKHSGILSVVDSKLDVNEVSTSSIIETSNLQSHRNSFNCQAEQDANGEAMNSQLSDTVSLEEHFSKQQERLKNRFNKLQKMLERLRNENLSFSPPAENDPDHSLVYLERELAQLTVANEQLGGIFPSFSDLPDTGNALERVLALELELAETLQNKKSDYLFQSSFLKQHNDKEAIFQSFRDINELIQEMLGLKRRNVNVETELKEMHSRYSQLSLQFAELEGERQKLIMTLKNRSPKKL